MFIENAEQYTKYRKSVVVPTVNGRRGIQIKIPCVNTVLVARELLRANTYNPNSMPNHKREDLEESIKLAGFAYPVAAWWDEDLEQFVIVDGFHRWLIAGYDYLGMTHVPVVPLDYLTFDERIMATWMFNKARGFHEVDRDAEVIRMLINQGVEEDVIAQKLGVDLETVHRYKQMTGIAELFKNVAYSMPWEMREGANGS